MRLSVSWVSKNKYDFKIIFFLTDSCCQISKEYVLLYSLVPSIEIIFAN